MRSDLDFLKFNFMQKVFLVLSASLVVFLKWPDLHLPVWADEMSYIPPQLWSMKASFFLPWNYDPLEFGGHPFLHPFILWASFFLFEPSIFTARAVSLVLSLFFLVSLYKMTAVVFKSSITAFYSCLFVMFLPYFLVYSSLIFADIPAMAFGFASIYAFTEKKHKSLLFFSIGMGAIRESSLAFFVPLILYGLAVPSYRKPLAYLLPGLFIFASHFYIFFLKTGGWIAHPYISGELYHNPNPEFFKFSVILENTRFYFLSLVNKVFPFVFLAGSVLSFVIYMLLLYSKKQKSHFGNEILIPFGMGFLWFFFWIMYPDQIERNYFPLLMFFVPFGMYFMVKALPYFHAFLIALCLFLAVQSFYIKPYAKAEVGYKQEHILKSKKFISYFDKKYGERLAGETIFSSWPDNYLMFFSEYEYVKTPIMASFDCHLDRVREYKAAIFRDTKDMCLPFYKAVKTSPSFVKVESPFKDYEIFLHESLLE